ncbi:MAG TPA: thioredoxin domain-containing protein [Saprospiraceae bacterium]|nr:thioredoxin domain-containing protein [Saprospiraceae bacterium]HQW55546.1 thioredoxin domain-containing protein [Saprospiraceae bacterium]
MRKYLSFITLGVLFLIYSCSVSKSSGNTDLTSSEFKQAIEKDKKAVVLDVRTPEEYSKGYIPHAVNYNWNDPSFKQQVSKYDKESPLYVYCLSGGRSASAANYLRQEGYKHVYELKGGILNWKNDGYALENGAPKEVSSSDVQNLTSLSLQDYEHIVNSSDLVLVDFFAPWCGPCREMAPFLKEISEQKGDKLKLIKINVDKNPDLAESLKVKGLPTLKLYKKNQLVWDQLGYASREVVNTQIEKYQ